jgi:hypothetical protein
MSSMYQRDRAGEPGAAAPPQTSRAAGGQPGRAAGRQAGGPVDWAAVRRASHACCCPAKPVAVVVMPPAPGRPEPVELLLCGHHYRVSARALSEAGAEPFSIDGTSLPAVQPPVPASC